MKSSVRPLAGFLLLLAMWQIVSAFQFIDRLFLPTPLDVTYAFVALLTIEQIYIDITATLIRVACAFVLAVAVGVPLGLFLGYFETCYRSIEGCIDFFRSTPATALFPLSMLLFGVGDSAKIAVAAFSGALIIVFNTAYGVLQAPKLRQQSVLLMGASTWQLFFSVVIYESLPQTLLGLRNALSLMLVIIVVTEMFIGSSSGIGKCIIDYQLSYRTAEMYGVILISGAIGYLLNAALLQVEKRLLFWKQ